MLAMTAGDRILQFVRDTEKYVGVRTHLGYIYLYMFALNTTLQLISVRPMHHYSPRPGPQNHQLWNLTRPRH